ncbi:MAG: hypothetical protein JWO38_5904 [Gemmataceae bacterium]|nr:hypothetical protein [Gemmataceae bacterium]
MKLTAWATPVAWCLFASTAPAQDGTRFAERTPLPHLPPAHTMERAGNPQTVARWAIPGGTRSETGGYVGGGSLRGNRIFATGPGAVTGPAAGGTFGWDFVGLRGRSGRVFLAPSADPSAGSMIGRNYRTDGPQYIPDVVSLRPFRRAVLEKKEAMAERK